MIALDDVLKAISADPGKGVFVSRSGAEKQRELALWVADRLKAHGYIPVVQDAHFKRENFRLAMDRTLATGARVLALMSREFLDSAYCMEEATTALDIKHSGRNRLVLFNIDGCEPLGVLRNVDRVDFHKVWKTGDGRAMEQTLLDALGDPIKLDGSIRIPAPPDADQVVHIAVLAHDERTFKGREDDLKRLHDTLWGGGTAALTRARGQVGEVSLHGPAGVGKTTLARAYAWRHRGEYHGIWWVRAERQETLIDDLIELGARDMPQLKRWDDRTAAAQLAIRRIAESRVNQPWLLVFDNAPGPGAVSGWRPERNAHVLITSRNPAWDMAVSLDVMKPEAAVDFLCDTAARKQPADREEAAALAKQLGYLPLALAHAASMCRANRRIRFADYGRRLAEFWTEKPGHDVAHRHYGKSVYATFTMALDEIVAGGPSGDPTPCPEAELLIELIADMPYDDVPINLLVNTPLAEDKLDDALKALIGAGLVNFTPIEDGDGALSLHPLIKEIAKTRYKESDNKAAVQSSVVTISGRLISLLRTKLSDENPLRHSQQSRKPIGTKIFISYRRADTRHIAGRIYDFLAREFGDAEIFFDIDVIPPGVDFRTHIAESIKECAVILAVIGPKWVSWQWKYKRGLLSFVLSRSDFVEIELALAMEEEIPVMPLPIDDTPMPVSSQLPHSLRELVFRNALPVRGGRDFRIDMQRLTKAIRELRSENQPQGEVLHSLSR